MKKNYIFTIIIAIVSFSIIFAIYTETITKSIIFNLNDQYEDIQDVTLDVDSLININNKQDILNKKNSLINFIWNEKEFPYYKTPYDIHENFIDLKYNDLENLKQIDKIEIKMDFELNSIAYHFIPDNSNNILLVYHQGHSGDFFNGKKTIQFFLDKGYSIIAFSMPLMGMNNQPIVDVPNSDPVLLTSHKQLHLLESTDFSPIKFFVEPIAVSLNYLDEKFDYDSYYFVGLSGGGWTAILYSAIDDRISQTYSVAGSYPIFLRDKSEDVGDYEQKVPELYQTANYLELYILGSYGENRKLIQIFNKYDPCCFAGERFTTYHDHISKKLYSLNLGEFDIILDDTHREHKISDYALEEISKIMKN